MADNFIHRNAQTNSASVITIGAPEYWHFLRNPSDIDSDLHDGFFLSLGVAGGALGLAGGLAAAPFIAAFAGSASSFSIPTLGTIVTPSGTVMLGITGGTTVTVTGSQAMTAAGMMSAALLMAHPNHDKLEDLRQQIA